MKILLYDLETSGHHIQHINYLADYFTGEGDQVQFFTWRSSKHIKRLPIDRDNFRVKYLKKRATKRVSENIAKRSLQDYRGISQAFKSADEWNADVFQLMSIDRSEIPLYANLLLNYYTGYPKVYATLIVPYFKSNNQNSQFSGRGLYHRLNKFFIRRLLNAGKLQKLFVLSQQTKDFLNGEWCDLSNSTIQALPDPIEYFNTTKTKEEARERLDLPSEKKIFLYFGELRWDKGPEILLKAASEIEKDFYLVLAGSGSKKEKKKVENIRQEFRDSDRLITRLDFIPDEEVEDYYLSADFVVLPYRKSYKGTSGILQHAAAAQRPVLASDVGQIGDIIQEWGLGVTVPPESPERLRKAMKGFLNEERDLNRINQNAKDYAEKHHWKKMAKK